MEKQRAEKAAALAQQSEVIDLDFDLDGRQVEEEVMVIPVIEPEVMEVEPVVMQAEPEVAVERSPHYASSSPSSRHSRSNYQELLRLVLQLRAEKAAYQRQLEEAERRRAEREARMVAEREAFEKQLALQRETIVAEQAVRHQFLNMDDEQVSSTTDESS